MPRIIVTGSDGRFGKILQKLNNKLIFRNKKQLNILSKTSIQKNLKKYKPSHILHLGRIIKTHESS